MTDTSLDLSPGGLRFPYHRFLADIASGLFAMFFIIYILHAQVAVPFWVVQSKASLDAADALLSRDERIFFMILLGLATVPVGLILNGVGFLLFGWVQAVAVGWYSRWARVLVRAADVHFRRDLLDDLFLLKDAHEKIYKRAKLFEGILEARSPLALNEFRHVTGLKTLIRSLALLALISLIVLGCSFLSFAALVVGMLLMGLLEYYLCLAILFKAMTMMLDEADVKTILDDSEKKAIGPSLTKMVRSFPASTGNSNPGS